MKIDVNGQLVDATPEQEAAIIAFQQSRNQNPDVYKMALQTAIDIKASEKSYSSGVSCSSYAQSTNEQWAAEANAFIAWRDSCYEYAYNYLAQAQGGEIQNPTVDNFIAGLPEMEWPNNE